MRRARSLPGWSAFAAAVATVVATLILDVVGGASTEHVIALGSVSVLVGLLRLHRFGREHRVAACLASATVLAQPALHIAGEVWDRWMVDLQSGHSVAHLGLLIVYVAVAVVAVLLVAVVDVLLLACAEAIHRLAHLLRTLVAVAPEPRGTKRPCATTPVRAIVDLLWKAYTVRRGPPPRIVAG